MNNNISPAQALLSFLPHHVVQDILDHPEESTLEREQRFDIVALFADVSGFTAISEALGKSSRGGAEELTSILNRYFAEMIDLVRSYGGIVGKFGGDAMTVLFPTEETGRTSTTRRAVRCALEMQNRMTAYEAIETSAGTFSLAMKAGLAAGEVFCTTVGDPQIRLEYIIAGDVLDLCADAEHLAEKGEVVIHDDLLDELDTIDIFDTRDGYTCITGIHDAVSHHPLSRDHDQASLPIDKYMSYLHPTIAERLFRGRAAFVNEHRRVTVLFVSFAELDYANDPDVSRKLQAYFEQVVRIIQRYDGYLNKIDMGDKGSKYIVMFGAPVSHENDEERALRCAFDLNELPFTRIRTGINTGFVYCGQVGSHIRQEYTVMGDTVNLAARLMQLAEPGEIIVSRDVRNAAKRDFEWEEREPVRVKGKSEPIEIAALKRIHSISTSVMHAVSYRLPLVGRQAELDTVQEKLATVAQGNGQILAISADAGMGKSRLAVEITRMARESGFEVVSGECESYAVDTSYHVWRMIWRSLLDLNRDDDFDVQIVQLENILAQAGENLAERLPLFGTILQLPIEETEALQSLEPQIRQEVLHNTLLTLLRWYASSQPILFVIEDLHWIDPLSRDLLNFLGRNIVDLPVFFLLMYRPVTSNVPSPHDLYRFPYFEEIQLREFEAEETEQLVRLKVAELFGADRTLPQSFIDRVGERAQGNPFYIEELLNFVKDQDVDVTDETSLETLDLPDTLHNLIVSRIDRLAEDDKLIMKVASVIGRVFPANWIWGGYPDAGTPEEILRRLEQVKHIQLIAVEREEPQLEYLFKHILTQEVTYESLAYSTRQALHEAIGQFVEETFGGALNQFIDVLAYHYGRSQNVEKKREYVRQAADIAKASYANDAAVHYYESLLDIVDDTERIDILCELAETYRIIGDWQKSNDLFQQAISEAPEHSVQRAKALSLRGHLLTFMASPAEGAAQLERAVEAFESLEAKDGLATALNNLSRAYLSMGQSSTALLTIEQHDRLVHAQNNYIGMVEADMNRAWVYQDRGEPDRALSYLQDALGVATMVKYRFGIMAARNDMAGVYYAKGDIANAVLSTAEALKAANEMGFLQGAAKIVSNMGWVYAQERDFDVAVACYAFGLDAVLELGEVSQLIFTLGNVLVAYIETNQYDSAAILIDEIEPLMQAIGDHEMLPAHLFYRALLNERMGEYDLARRFYNEATASALDSEAHEIHFRSRIALLRVAAATNEITAEEAITRLRALLDGLENPMQMAEIWYEMWKLAPDDNEIQSQAEELHAELYAQFPNVQTHQRYEQISGQQHPPPDDLPAPPDYILEYGSRLDDLIEQSIAFIGQMTSS